MIALSAVILSYYFIHSSVLFYVDRETFLLLHIDLIHTMKNGYRKWKWAKRCGSKWDVGVWSVWRITTEHSLQRNHVQANNLNISMLLYRRWSIIRIIWESVSNTFCCCCYCPEFAMAFVNLKIFPEFRVIWNVTVLFSE